VVVAGWWWVLVVVCKPILMFSFDLGQAEQYRRCALNHRVQGRAQASAVQRERAQSANRTVEGVPKFPRNWVGIHSDLQECFWGTIYWKYIKT
jgi:hypothetical protein